MKCFFQAAEISTTEVSTTEIDSNFLSLHFYRKDIHRKIHFANGQTLVSGSFDRKVLVYDINSGKLMRTIKGHTGSVKCVFVLEKKGIIISAGYDTSARYFCFINEVKAQRTPPY